MEKKLKTLVRLNKFLSESGLTSRRKAEELISVGRVVINGKVVTEMGVKIDPGKDIVEVDGEKVKSKKHIYYLLNKPRGVVTTTNDEKKRKTVIELINTHEKIFPVGRLDYNTTGVLLLTNDGDFTNLLTHPSNRIPRVYEVTLNRVLTEEDRHKLLNGIYLDQKKAKFEEVEFPKAKDRKFILVTGTEGRNHFVKNLFNALGYDVLKLHRKSFAGIQANIPEGEYRKMNEDEIQKLIRKYAH